MKTLNVFKGFIEIDQKTDITVLTKIRNEG